MDQPSQFTIAVEYHPINPPKPVGFGIMKDGKPIAWLTLEQIEVAVARYKDMEAVRASDSAPDAR